jgi:hypothetical protein
MAKLWIQHSFLSHAQAQFASQWPFAADQCDKQIFIHASNNLVGKLQAEPFRWHSWNILRAHAMLLAMPAKQKVPGGNPLQGVNAWQLSAQMDQEHLPCARFIKWHLDIRHIERSSISGPVDPVGRSRNSIFFSCQKVFVSPSPTPGFVLDSSDQTSGKSHTHSRVLNFHTRSECENPTGPNYNH